MNLTNERDDDATRLTSESTSAKPISIFKQLGFNRLFLVFIFASFLGVLIETIWVLLKRSVFESRKGLIYGPFNLVYGIGAVLMVLILSRFKKDWSIFLGSALIGGAFEWLCSLFQELSFGTVSWYYEDIALNIHGRTNVTYMIYWGALGLVFIRAFFPAFNRLMDKIIPKVPPRAPTFVVSLLAVFMFFNVFISYSAVWRQSHRRVGEAATNRFESFLDRHYSDERLEVIFPNMSIITSDGPETVWKH